MKIITVIQARMGSHRLPGKVLMDLSGKPALFHLISALNLSKLEHEIVIATSVLPEDDPIYNFAGKHGVRAVRGPSQDVLDRFRIAVEDTNPDIIVRVTGDDPLIDPGLFDEVIKAHLKGDWDYTSNSLARTYPRGMDTEVVNRDILEEAWETTQDKDDREHVTLYIRDRGHKYRLQSLEAKGDLRRPEIRLCIDTEEDYRFIKSIYEGMYQGEVLRVRDILKFLDAHPEIKSINADIQQKKVKGKIY